MTESALQNQIRLALSEYGIAFRTNSGEFYQGKRIYDPRFGQDVLVNLRRVAGLPKGFPDLLFVGEGTVAFLECKTPHGRVRPEQEKFIEQMRRLHHRAGIARSVQDAIQIVTGGMTYGTDYGV